MDMSTNTNTNPTEEVTMSQSITPRPKLITQDWPEDVSAEQLLADICSWIRDSVNYWHITQKDVQPHREDVKTLRAWIKANAESK